MEEKKTLQTMYGMLTGVTRYDTYFDGGIRECELREANEISTDYGIFIPQYTEDEAIFERQKKHRSSVVFHENGMAKSIALETQTDVKTPIGIFPAELVTFYDNECLNRVFPLNGKINGYWSEEDEGNLAQAYKFDFEFGSFEAKIISLRFYPTGELKSLALWPGTSVTLKTPAGDVEVKTGFSLYKSGLLKSLEPAKPKAIHTSIGSYLAYDNDAIGIHADSGSLRFSEEGRIIGFTSTMNGVVVIKPDGSKAMVGPRLVDSYTEESEKSVLPVRISIEPDTVKISHGHNHMYTRMDHKFSPFISHLKGFGGCTDCSSCDSCG